MASPRPFTIGDDHIGDDTVALALGDNIFHGNSFSDLLEEEARLTEG
ncbi:hypothetical protein NORO109296_09505 [Nocardiopsis rhodophaea]